MCGNTGWWTPPQGARLRRPAGHPTDPLPFPNTQQLPDCLLWKHHLPLGLKVLSHLDSSHLYNSTQSIMNRSILLLQILSFTQLFSTLPTTTRIQKPKPRTWPMIQQPPKWVSLCGEQSLVLFTNISSSSSQVPHPQTWKDGNFRKPGDA